MSPGALLARMAVSVTLKKRTVTNRPNVLMNGGGAIVRIDIGGPVQVNLLVEAAFSASL